MRCPNCHSSDSKVIDTRALEDEHETRRRRICALCSHRFTTRERIERVLPRIIKKNDERESFNQEKLQRGLGLALEKRPVSTDDLNKIITRVVQKIIQSGESEFPSRVIGEIVMEELRQIDTVAYVRFASVYKRFQSIEDFQKALNDLE